MADMSEWHGRETLPEPVELIPGPDGLEFDGMFDDEPFDKQLRLLAPIPGPAVLAALAEYGDAVAAYDADELRDANRELTDDEWSASEAIERAVSDATAVLDAAIRAERDGDA